VRTAFEGSLAAIVPRGRNLRGNWRGQPTGQGLAEETGVGLPHSSLIKPETSPITPTEPAFVVPPPPLPLLASAFRGPRGDEPSIEVEIEDAVRPPNATLVDAGPSKDALLERAASLGPVRGTWESFLVPNDPILGAKMQPRVAERRARLRRVVKATLGVCGALCVVSLIASAFGGGNVAEASSAHVAEARSTPATAVTTVEKIDEVKRVKAAREGMHPLRRASFPSKHR
jgi:hypothetical protein